MAPAGQGLDATFPCIENGKSIYCGAAAAFFRVSVFKKVKALLVVVVDITFDNGIIQGSSAHKFACSVGGSLIRLVESFGPL